MPAIKQEVMERSPQAPLQTMNDTSALVQMIERAARDPNIDVVKMERLYAMHASAVAAKAKVDFDEALAAMQTELPIIAERGEIKIGQGKPQRYALWEDINEAIKPILTKHGFALRFVTGQEDGKIIVTGVLSRGGHREETTMHLPIDTSGSKNAVQAVGSSTSYGKRYTAQALLNLTSRGEDDDGVSGGTSTITNAQFKELNALADEVGADKRAFCNYMGVEGIAVIPAKDYGKAKQALEAKRAKK